MQSLPILLLVLIPLIVVINAQQREREVANLLNRRLAQLVQTKNEAQLKNLFQNDFHYNICRGAYLNLGQYMRTLLSYTAPVQFSHTVAEAKIKHGILEMRSFYKIQGKAMTVVFNVKEKGNSFKITSGYQEC